MHKPRLMPKRKKVAASASVPTSVPSSIFNRDGNVNSEHMNWVREQHAANIRVSSEACKRKREGAASEANEEDVREEHKRKANEEDVREEHKRKAASEVLRCDEQLPLPESQQPLLRTTARRCSSGYEASPQTEERRRRTAPLVWRREGVCPLKVPTFAERADAEGTRDVKAAPSGLFEKAARDGLVVVKSDKSYATDGLQSHWHSSDPWRLMASCLAVKKMHDDKPLLISGGNLDIRLIGSGTFNLVLRPSEATPRPPYLFDKDFVYRITRTDSEDSKQREAIALSPIEHKYEELASVAGEAANAAMASLNGIGPEIFSVAIFPGIGPGNPLHYGAVYAMGRADRDLYRALQRAGSSDEVTRMAISASELVYEASRCGVLFTDIKPGNILVMPDGRLRLADFDASFFVRLPDKDWQCLLLANLSLLSAHVRNSSFDHRRAWAAAVAPLLQQLVERHDKYKSEWLFEARSVRVSFDPPSGNTDFEMQRLFTSLACSYFYKVGLQSCPAKLYRWEFKDQASLDNYWHVCWHRHRWPPAWPQRYTPLVMQLVYFALSEL